MLSASAFSSSSAFAAVNRGSTTNALPKTTRSRASGMIAFVFRSRSVGVENRGERRELFDALRQFFVDRAGLREQRLGGRRANYPAAESGTAPATPKPAARKIKPRSTSRLAVSGVASSA